MSIEIERGEKPKGLTHRELVVQFSNFKRRFGFGLFSSSVMQGKRDLLLGSLAKTFVKGIWEGLDPVDPFSDFKEEVDPTIAPLIESLIFQKGKSRKGKSKSVPGYRIHETGMHGLYVLEEFPNRVERRVYLVGSAERNKRFPKKE